jgi:hypothetical protein
MPFSGALFGGLLIGAAALLLYATVGRIAGVSGIAFGTTDSSGFERAWRLLFLLGLVAGAWLASLAAGPLGAPGPVGDLRGRVPLQPVCQHLQHAAVQTPHKQPTSGLDGTPGASGG